MRRAGQRRRRGAAAAHVRHDVAAEDRPADARQHLCVGLRARCGTGAARNRSMLEYAAPVPWAWSDCHRAGLAGGRRECRLYPRLDVNSFFAWLTAFQPTWYSAVPTMHQAILAHARHNRERAGGLSATLRPLCVSSATTPHSSPNLEETFETPVIEFYGMTETASSPIACNPLPPRQRKPGSVGLPVGWTSPSWTKEGLCCPAGQTGEVVVRGASVMAGYDGDPKRRPRPRLQAIGSRQGILVSSMTTGTCFSLADRRDHQSRWGERSPRRKSTKCSWNIQRWQRP